MRTFSKLLGFSVLAMAAAMVGCGDDGGNGGADAGPGSSDAGTAADASRSDAGRVRDAGSLPDSGPEIQTCDPFAPGSCPTGSRCSVVLRDPNTEDVSVNFECTPAQARPRGNGVRCTIFGIDALDGTAREDTDTALTDDCDTGSFCYLNRDQTRATCTPLCTDGTSCGASGFCRVVNGDPLFGTCDTAENCDPVRQTGCTGGRGCYFIGDTDGNLRGACFTPQPREDIDAGVGHLGESCSRITECEPGLICSSGVPPEGADAGPPVDPTCHRICSAGPAAEPDGGRPDAGPPVDLDGGVAALPSCQATTACVALPLEPGMVSYTPDAPGLCQ